MRHFEFKGAGSDKFWEIAVDGSALTTRWGRIGTAGRTTTTSVGTAAAAQAERDRRIGEKTKEGNLEVIAGEDGGVAARDPLAASAALVARPTPRPMRGAAEVRHGAAPSFDAALLAEGMRRSYPFVALKWQGGVDLAEPAASGRIGAALALLATGAAGAGPLEVDQQVALSLIWENEGLVDLWVARNGLCFAVDVMVRREALEVGFRARDGGMSGASTPRNPQSLEVNMEHVAGFWLRLGLWAAAASDADYAAMREACVVARAGAPSVRRALMSAAMWWEHDWHVEDASSFMAGPSGKVHLESGWLIGGCRDPELVLPLVERYLDDGQLDMNLVPHAAAIARLGPVALPALARFLSLSDHQDDWMTPAIQAVASIEHPDAHDLLVKWLAHDACRDTCRAWLFAHPQSGIAALLRAGARGRSSLGSALLGYPCRRHPDAVAALRAELSTDDLALVERLAAVGRHPAAPAEQVPALLRDPPWRKKQPPPQTAIVEGLTVLDRGGEVVWGPGERERLRPKAIVRSDWWSEGAAAGVVHLRLLPYACPDEDLLDIWNNYRVAGTWDGSHSLLALLARTDIEGLPGFLAYATAQPREGAELLLRVRDARIAPFMADCHVRLKAAGKIARSWLDGYPTEAALGLIPAAVGPLGTERDAAVAGLWFVARKNADIVREVAKEYRAVEAVDAILAADPLAEVPKKIKKLPDFWSSAAVRPPLVKDRSAALPGAAVDALAEMLSFSDLESPYAGIAIVKEACDARSLAAFAWDLFRHWTAAGSESASEWAMLALAHFGDDEAARDLAPYIRRWPRQSASTRAVKALDVLAVIGSDTALVNLFAISLRPPSPALGRAAAEKIGKVARDRGLTADELADRTVPDLDLDPDGSKVLDFGLRRFTVGFDEQLRPFVRNFAGEPLANLPTPGMLDDPQLAAAAVATWTAIKKDAQTICKAQVARFERAMCLGRRWDAPTFRLFLLEHPLLVHLVRRLVWATYSGDGAVAAAFRVTGGGAFTDAGGAAWELPDDARIGIPHPLELGTGALADWRTSFGDDAIVQPFAQLHRDTHAITDAERDATSLQWFRGIRVPWRKLTGLAPFGWRHAEPHRGYIRSEARHVAGCGYDAHLELEPGLCAGAMAESGDQVLGEVVLYRMGTWGTNDRGAFGTIDRIQLSELVRELGTLEV